VHGNLYGTPKAAVENALASGLDVLFDIDWQGTQQLVAALPADVVTVFILPPSMNELRARLERRAEDADTVISNRLSNAASEIGHWREYDYIVINDDLERALGGVRAILTAERLKRARQTGMADFISGLTAKA
jgi:guanylate kinase